MWLIIFPALRSVGHVCVTSVRNGLITRQANYISDFADEFEGAEVIGTDISPIQTSWVPPNLKLYEVPKSGS